MAPGVTDRLARAVERELHGQNVEYVNKRDTLRLGPVQILRIREGSWIDFQKRRLVRSGGTVEQYKQPHLVADLQVIESFTAVPGPALLAVGPWGSRARGPRQFVSADLGHDPVEWG